MTRTQAAVATLMRSDPQFIELCKMLDADPRVVLATISKDNPDTSDVSTPGNLTIAPPRRRRTPPGFRRALALGAIGATAAGAKTAVKGLKTEVGRAKLIPAAALAGDVLAGGELYQHFKTLTTGQQQQPVSKVSMSQLVRGSLTQHRRLVRATLDASKLPSQPSVADVAKRGVDADWAGTFSKLQADKRLAFGWASVCKVNGLPVVDRQKDYIDAEDLEDAAYHYVQRSRVGGDMHDRQIGKSNGRGLWFGLYSPAVDQPRQVADLVESVVITKQKKTAMGLPDDFPEGWWVGFRYHDDDVWEAIKKGERRGFSVHGAGLRKGVDYDELMAGAA